MKILSYTQVLGDFYQTFDNITKSRTDHICWLYDFHFTGAFLLIAKYTCENVANMSVTLYMLAFCLPISYVVHPKSKFPSQ